MYEHALTDSASALFAQLHRFRRFYLVGGTALALQIGHRLSVDLDCFTKEPLPSRLLANVKRTYQGASIRVTYRAPDQLNLIANGVQVTFFQYDYPIIDPFITWRRFPIASIREIAAMKAFAIGKRLSYKDYVDWYFLLQEEHVTLPEVMRHAKQKFGGDFNDRLFLSQLASFDDVPSQEIAYLRDEPTRRTIERFLKGAITHVALE